MAVIKKSDDAPDDLVVVLLGNTELDFSKGDSVESDDYDVVGNAEVNPYLKVERSEDEVLAPSGEETTASAVSPNPSSTPEYSYDEEDNE